MPTTLKKHARPIASWQQTAGAKEIKEAYLKGHRDGSEESAMLFREKRDANIAKAAAHTSEVLDHLEANGFQPREAYLKIESWYEFEVLVGVRDEDFLNKTFQEVYSFVGELEERVEEELYSIWFSFVGTPAELDKSIVIRNGFVREFVQQ